MGKKNTGDDGNFQRKDCKPCYQSPTIIPLGEIAKGWGQGQPDCTAGFTDLGLGACKFGSAPSGTCSSGSVK